MWPSNRPHEKKLSGPVSSQKESFADKKLKSKSVGKSTKLEFPTSPNLYVVQSNPQSPVVIWPPVPTDKDQPRKKIIIKQTKGISNVEQLIQTNSCLRVDDESRKTKRIVELSGFEVPGRLENINLAEDAAKRKAVGHRRLWKDEEKMRNKERRGKEKKCDGLTMNI